MHWAAYNGHDSVVEPLLQAKATVDVQDNDSRGLGGGYWGGKPHEALGFRCEEVNEDVDVSLMVQLFGGYYFHNLLERVSKYLHQFLVLLFANTTMYIVPTFWVGVSQGMLCCNIHGDRTILTDGVLADAKIHAEEVRRFLEQSRPKAA